MLHSRTWVFIFSAVPALKASSWTADKRCLSDDCKVTESASEKRKDLYYIWLTFRVLHTTNQRTIRFRDNLIVGHRDRFCYSYTTPKQTPFQTPCKLFLYALVHLQWILQSTVPLITYFCYPNRETVENELLQQRTPFSVLYCISYFSSFWGTYWYYSIFTFWLKTKNKSCWSLILHSLSLCIEASYVS